MPTPRDYFAKGWPCESAIVESFPTHSVDGDVEMFMLAELVNESGTLVVRKASAGAARVLIAVDNHDAYDVQSSKLLPVWTNVSGKIIETPHVDVTGLAVGDEVEVQGAGLLVKKASAAAVGRVQSISTDGDVRVILY